MRVALGLVGIHQTLDLALELDHPSAQIAQLSGALVARRAPGVRQTRVAEARRAGSPPSVERERPGGCFRAAGGAHQA